MRALPMQHAASGHWVGAAALSNMGFYVPTSAAGTEIVPLNFLPCPELAPLCKGSPYRIQSTQVGLEAQAFG